MFFNKQVINPRDEFLSELRRVEQEIRNNEQIFNTVNDDKLIEYTIYQNLALQKHHQYLMNQIKLA